MNYLDVLYKYVPSPEAPMGGETFNREGFLEATRFFLVEAKSRIRLLLIFIVVLFIILILIAYRFVDDPVIVAAIIGGNGLVAGLLVGRIIDLERQRTLAIWMERMIPFADDSTIQKILESTIRLPI